MHILKVYYFKMDKLKRDKYFKFYFKGVREYDYIFILFSYVIYM